MHTSQLTLQPYHIHRAQCTLNSTLITVQYSAVQCSTVRCSAVQCSVQCAFARVWSGDFHLDRKHLSWWLNTEETCSEHGSVQDDVICDDNNENGDSDFMTMMMLMMILNMTIIKMTIMIYMINIMKIMMFMMMVFSADILKVDFFARSKLNF